MHQEELQCLHQKGGIRIYKIPENRKLSKLHICRLFVPSSSQSIIRRVIQTYEAESNRSELSYEPDGP